MELPELRVFLEKAGSELAAIRGGLLLAAQNGFSVRDLETAATRIDRIESTAGSLGMDTVLGFATRVRTLAVADVNAALDVVAALEAALLQFNLRADDFLDNVDDLVEASFGEIAAASTADLISDAWTDLEIDDETLEIFQDEADALLANITASLVILETSPGDTNALWEIRRNAHTFKGAAGIVGFSAASTLAHRVEDLLDKIVETRHPVDQNVVELLGKATGRLTQMTVGADRDAANSDDELASGFDALLVSLARPGSAQVRAKAARGASPASPTGASHAASAPIVRVSLDRLDDLLSLARRLVEGTRADGTPHLELAQIIAQKLLQLRMVRFGTLETRLSRAVHVTCQEEGKKADLTIDGADIEIDTQIVDALIEPLLHLLKNAVVHGIEPAETRRLLAKKERGRINIAVSDTSDGLTITVSDDGGGISTNRLIQKALTNGLLTSSSAETLTESEALELIFHRGLTTAESLSMNAGRGVGMSIIRQSVESHGGTLVVCSDAQKGASFTITIPATATTTVVHEQPSAPDGMPLVLVVDDSSSIRRQTAKHIEDAGLRVITAIDGADALELLLNGKHEPDLILSDVEMPNMNGWEFLDYVKTDKNLGHLPIVMVTSLDATKYRQMAARMGAADYIVKPFGPKDLENILAKFCAVSA